MFSNKQINTDNGLSQTTNPFIYQDKRGFVWIGSIDGLNRFDGKKIKIYKSETKKPNLLLGGNIQSPFFETSNGDIWFTTELGINCFRIKKGCFDNYTIEAEKSVKNVHHYAFFLEHDRYLWILAFKKVYKVDILNPDINHKVVVDSCMAGRCAVDMTKEGSIKRLYLWFWDYRFGFEVIEFNSNGLPIHRTIFEKARSQLIHKVRQALPDVFSPVTWLASDNGVIEFNSEQSKIEAIHVPPGKHTTVSTIMPLSKKTLLITVSDGTVFKFNKTDKTFEAADSENLNRSTKDKRSVETMIITPDSSIWWSVRNEGVFFTTPKKSNFSAFGMMNLIKEPVWSIFEYDSTIWLCGKGHHFFAKKHDKNAFLKKAGTAYAKLFADSKGGFWHFSMAGLMYANKSNGQWLQKVSFPESASFMDILLLKNDQVAVACLQGVFIIDLTRLQYRKISKNSVYSLGKDTKGRLWQGSDNYIQIWSPDKKGFRELNLIENTGDVLCFKYDSVAASMWVGTSQGLLAINTETFESYTITEQSGLPNQYIYAIAQDKKGNLWLSTNQGIIRFNPDVKPYQFKQYTTRDGLSSNEYNPGAVLMDSRGYIWFGSTKGVDVFHPDSIHDLGHAPQLAIVGLKVHDREWQGDSSIEVVQRIDLPYNQNTLRLELAAMEYLDPEHNQFKVILQLKGETATWTALGTQNFVTYANLKPGSYTFRFIACNAEGIWVEEKNARTLHIDIRSHWSDTWWFRTLLILLLLAFVATAFYYRYRLRVQQLQNEKAQREAERQRMELEKTAAAADSSRKIAESEMKLLRSQLNPHFLFNAMNSINRYILSNEKEKASEYLGQFAQLTRSILDNSRSLSIPLSDELKMLHQYLALESHRFQQNIHWTFTISPDIDEENLLVPSMLLQPFAENAVLHGLAPKGGGHIAVEISQQEGSLQCIIRDDGVGRRAAPSTDGKPRHASAGMRLISERIDAFAEIEGQAGAIAILDLKDAEGNPTGTEVVIRLPWVEAV